ncbi:right-handed parallel beta-helix repeat-containing protein [Oscillospiraceae bacterium HV4-5-C5C]|nr:right-handed parallel beta-helix repeat-containing protein [Oscillospiraceae bacterium HV4-5-C5C]
MQIYIDPQNGKHRAAGSLTDPFHSVSDASINAGDQVYIKRGSIIKQELFLIGGTPESPVTYSSYGQGFKPVINPSIDASSPEAWEKEKQLSRSLSIWRYKEILTSEVCNIVFNDHIKGLLSRTGNLRWDQSELVESDEWYYDNLGNSMRGQPERWPDFGKGQLYLVSSENPGMQNQRIEIVVWGKRNAINAQSHCIIEDLCVEKSGVHGFSATKASNITLRNCDFRFIGGAVFDLSARIRLGNAVEFWDGASDCVVEHCTFTDIYDSGVTHQGGLQSSLMAERLYFRNNLFIRCGLAAYEWRGPSSRDVYFENNTCLEAGGAFTMQGQKFMRKTEQGCFPCSFIMIWLLEKPIAANEIYCHIRHNYFGDVGLAGQAIAITVDPSYFSQFDLNQNTYGCYDKYKNQKAIAIIGNHHFAKDLFDQYRQMTGFDQDSSLINLVL